MEIKQLFNAPFSQKDTSTGFRLARNIGPKISITGTLPEATLNQAYAGYTFGVVGSTGNKTWSISEGTLPPGMSFSANGTLSGTPNTAGTYTFVIRVESGGYWDEIEVEVKVIASGLKDSDGDGVNDYRETYDGTSPNNPNSFDPMSVGVFAHYPFDGDAKDESGLGKHGTIMSGGFGVDRTGNSAKALSIAQDANYTKVPLNSTQFNGDYSIVANVNFDDFQKNYPSILYGENSFLVVHGCGPAYTPTNKVQEIVCIEYSSIAQGGGSFDRRSEIYSSKKLNAKQWYQVCITRTVDSIKVFVDGILCSTAPSKTGSLLTGNFIQVGKGYLTESHQSMRGSIDDLKFYNRALTATQVAQLYVKPNMVTVQGGTLPASSGLGNQTVETFQIGKYETTWDEWQSVRTYAIANGYDLTGVGAGTASTHPVQMVSWYDVVKWSNAKSQMEGMTPVYTVNGTTYKTGQSVPNVNSTANGYRLPSEKEWEWAARGGISSQGYTYSGSNDLNAVAWYGYNLAGGARPVGTKAANELGIYDMSGNAWEWCWDLLWTNASYRRLRGGSWYDGVDANASVSNHVANNLPDWRGADAGFRLARSLGNMVTVQGGTLPASSGLGNQTVSTFQIGKYETTWEEWQSVRTYAIANGYDLTGVGNGTASTHPVQTVSWYDVVKWSNAKSQMEGLTPVYTVNGTTYKTGQVAPTVSSAANGYRLPSEREWEWAARGGGLNNGCVYSGSNTANDVAWTYENSSDGTKAVGTKAANELGIYDMSGNVWEWCWDVYDQYYYSTRRIRGGSWGDYAFHAAVANRGKYYYPDGRKIYFGFRLARSSGN